MIFKKDALIEQIKTKIEELDLAAEIHLTEQFDALAKREADYILETYGAWSDFHMILGMMIEQERAITIDAFPKELFGGGRPYIGNLQLFQPSRETPKLKDTSSELRSLLALLEAVEDKEITTTGLERIGFKDVRSLF